MSRAVASAWRVNSVRAEAATVLSIKSAAARPPTAKVTTATATSAQKKRRRIRQPAIRYPTPQAVSMGMPSSFLRSWRT
jgi:hypothetical protein